ncbi:MAG: hypothetical protein AB1726_00990 [Planctomycetota bacterium]
MGERIALLGHESGVFECWMWPIKVGHDLSWRLSRPGAGGPPLPPASERRVEVAPGGLAFAERGAGWHLSIEIFADLRRRGLVLLFRGGTDGPAEVEISFTADFRPMWPAGLGGQIGALDRATGAFLLTEELGRFAVLLGGPGAEIAGAAFDHALPAAPVRLRLPLAAGGPPAVLVIAGAELDPEPLSAAARLGLDQSATGLARAAPVIAAARSTWREFVERWPAAREEVETHWRELLARTPALVTSDPAFDEAFRWARIAIARAWVTVDGLGRGLVAGLGPSRGGDRPGFGWFFDGDALVASRALGMLGDFEGGREVLRFAASHQRADGKLMHELTLSARLCRWLEDYPYAYYKGMNAADFVLALERHVRAAGDLALAGELWGTVERALRWCEGATDEQGRLATRKTGIAAVEAGPLSDVIETEAFLDGAWIGALRAAEWLAERLGREDFASHARGLRERAAAAFEEYWSEAHGRYGFARLTGGGRCDDHTAYLGFPLALGLGRPDHALASAMQLNAPALTSDWGARMFAVDSAVYDPAHYNTGSVFPFLTGYVALALFRHAIAPAAHQVLASQVALTGFGGRGFVEEHLVGDRAEIPARGVPHQIFSSYVIPEVILRGLFGLEPDATVPRLDVRPCLPPDWERAAVERWRVGATLLDLAVTRTRLEGRSAWRIEFERREGPPLAIGLAPLLPPLSRVVEADAGGQAIGYAARVCPSGAVEVRLADRELRSRLAVSLEVVEGPDVRMPADLPARGGTSRHPRFVGSKVRGGELVWRIAGRTGSRSAIPFHCDAEVDVEGGAVDEDGRLVVSFPAEKTPTSANSPAEFSDALVRVRPRTRA